MNVRGAVALMILCESLRYYYLNCTENDLQADDIDSKFHVLKPILVW